MIEDVIVTDDQQEKTIESTQEEADRLSKNNQNLTEEVNRKVFTAVRSLNDEVDKMKTQTYTITYKKKVPGEAFF